MKLPIKRRNFIQNISLLVAGMGIPQPTFNINTGKKPDAPYSWPRRF